MRCPRVVVIALAWITAVAATAGEGRVVREIVHGESLEHSVTGEDPDRAVSVYLPPGYDDAPEKRFAVVYLLHGIGDTDRTWTDGEGLWRNILSVMDGGIADHRFGDMIVVMPDQRTTWFGSFYVNSEVNGGWEDFTVRELVSFIDGKYRTLAGPGGRGIAGHSMGGYGAITLGMKHPEVYSAVFAMNPAVLGWGGELQPENPAFAAVHQVKSLDELAAFSYEDNPHVYLDYRGWIRLGLVTVARAFSPDPDTAPFYARFPYVIRDGVIVPDELVFRRWTEHMPLYTVERYRENLVALRGLRFDTGWIDEFQHIPITCRELSVKLTALGVPHVFEEYNGDHRDRLWGRKGRLSTEVLPWFWLLLDRE